jgi:hypothetical protein
MDVSGKIYLDRAIEMARRNGFQAGTQFECCNRHYEVREVDGDKLGVFETDPNVPTPVTVVLNPATCGGINSNGNQCRKTDLPFCEHHWKLLTDATTHASTHKFQPRKRFEYTYPNGEIVWFEVGENGGVRYMTTTNTRPAPRRLSAREREWPAGGIIMPDRRRPDIATRRLPQADETNDGPVSPRYKADTGRRDYAGRGR